MITLGIDQSFTSTGIVIINDTSIVDSVIVTSDKTLSNHQRAINIANDVAKLVNKHKPLLVAIEGLAFGGQGDATRNLAGLQFLIIDRLIKANVPYIIVAPTTVKKHATGSGKATKQQVAAALPTDINTHLTTNHKKTKGYYDCVDAFFLATYATTFLNTRHTTQESQNDSIS